MRRETRLLHKEILDSVPSHVTFGFHLHNKLLLAEVVLSFTLHHEIITASSTDLISEVVRDLWVRRRGPGNYH